MILTLGQLAESEPRWFCLSAKPKHERLAAANLNQMEGVESFCPRIRFRKATKRGPVWFVEALFPGYLFAKFEYAPHHRRVQGAHGVARIVRFGSGVASVEEEIVANLRQLAGDDETLAFDPQMRPGDEVKIAEGAFQGLNAVVTQLLPAKERVKVLLDFLGRPIEAELPAPALLPIISPRDGCFTSEA